MVVTNEFMSDFSVNSLADLAAYSPNMAVDYLDTAADPNPQYLGGANLGDTRIRIRGLSATTAVDFFETAIAIDSYNAERVELSSGANSILFGFGSPGGLVNVMTKRARVNRNTTALRVQVGEWRHSRYELDHNQVILPGKLAVRLNGLLQNSGGWRKWDFNDVSRGAISVRLDPFKNTSIVANYENGEFNAHVTRPVNAYDALAIWEQRGALTKSDVAWIAADRANGINRSTATRAVYVTDADGSAPFVLTTSNAANLRLLESTYEDLNTPALDRAGLTLMPSTQFPYGHSAYGPGSTRDINFKRFVGSIEHRITNDVTVELAYNRERAGEWVKTIQGANLTFAGDPNATIPNPGGGTTPIPNSNAGDYFLEGRWVADRGEKSTDVIRGSLAWQLDLGRFGRHKLAGMAEKFDRRQGRFPLAEILVDERGVPINNTSVPENAANQVWRRHYVTPGDFDTYIAGNGAQDFTVVRNGRTFHNTFVNSGVPGNVDRFMRTLLGAAQSSFWEGRVVVTAGIRWDRIAFEQHGNRRLPANDPDVVAGRMIANAPVYTPEIVDTSRFKTVTHTEGIVYHVNRWLSGFFNHGTNNGQPQFNTRVLPDETLPPPYDGVTDDYGFMLNLLDGRIFMRATAFKTSELETSGGSFSVGLRGGENDLIQPSTRILETLLANGRITSAEYTRHLLGDEANLTGISDVVNSGYELSTWFNVTRNFTGVFNFSYTKTDRSRIVPEFEGWFERENAFWHQTPGAGSLVNDVSNSTIDQEADALRRTMDGIREFHGLGYGERPYKVNVSGRYSFARGRLAGAFVGGGARWQSRPKLGRALLGRTADGLRILGDTFYGPEEFKMDAFIGYRRKLPIGNVKSEFTLQLNVSNLTNEDDLVPLRYNPKQSGYSRVLLPEPRKFRLTAGLAF